MDEPNGYHYVQSGDTLTGIAVRHHTTVPELARLNGIQHPSQVRPDTYLRLPASATHVDARHIAALNAALRITSGPRPADRLPEYDAGMRAELSTMDMMTLYELRDAARTLAHAAERTAQTQGLIARRARNADQATPQ